LEILELFVNPFQRHLMISLDSKAERTRTRHSYAKTVSLAENKIFRIPVIGKRLRPGEDFRDQEPKKRHSSTEATFQASESSRGSKDTRAITRCSSGHTYYAIEKVSKSQCPFCDDFLAEFKRLATSRNAELLSTNQSKYLRFMCAKHKEPFTLTVADVRKGDSWCNLCGDKKYREASPKARELPRRIVDPVFEQAHLLDSARALYNNKATIRSRSVDIQPAARRDPHYALNSQQTLSIHAAIAPATGDQYWVSLVSALQLNAQWSTEQIYRHLARQIHPDKCNHPMASEVFKKLATEYKQLRK